MKVTPSAQEIFAQLQFARREGKTVGMVPTMGALHEGHLSLVKKAKAMCDLAVATIFVNPTQFAPHEDLAKYPRTLDADLAMLHREGTDFVFTPEVASIYPEGFSTFVEPPAIALPLEGVCRPGHFRGVATVVLKLFHLIPADVAFFGSKDYQQLAVIKKMVADLDVPIRIEACPTVRENDGLAMSSRNRYLSQEERARALGLWRALTKARMMAEKGERSIAHLEAAMIAELQSAPVDAIEYARVVDAESLQDLVFLDRPAVALLAAKVGGTRLIDNQRIEVP